MLFSLGFVCCCGRELDISLDELPESKSCSTLKTRDRKIPKSLAFNYLQEILYRWTGSASGESGSVSAILRSLPLPFATSAAASHTWSKKSRPAVWQVGQLEDRIAPKLCHITWFSCQRHVPSAIRSRLVERLEWWCSDNSGKRRKLRLRGSVCLVSS